MLDPQAEALLQALAAANLPPLSQLSPEEARRLEREVPLPPLPPGVAVVDRSVPGPAGDLRVRCYTPQAARGPLPLLVYYHGGGFVLGSLETHGWLCAYLALKAEAVVASVDYRLAPEAPFPAPLEDAYAAWLWLAHHAEELGATPARLAIGGDSAGGNLAAGVSRWARDRKAPLPRLQVLFYPATDMVGDYPSKQEFAQGYGLTLEDMQWFGRHYLRRPEEAFSPEASPLRADLRGLPPTWLLTAEYDPLRDEGEAYLKALVSSGVSAGGRRCLGLIHGFASQAHLLERGREALDETAHLLQLLS